MTDAAAIARPATDVPRPAVVRSGREAWIDRVRASLTALVVAHHAAIAYGASGSWFLKVRTDTDVVLTFLAAVNQAFFMGAFFLIAGLLAPGSIARRSAGAFLRDRAVRLGVPVLAFGFLIGPLTVALATAPAHAIVADWLARVSRLDFVLGPLWFPAALLIFSAILLLVPGRPPRAAQPPRLAALLALAVATGLGALAIRQVVPVGATVLGFQLGYFATYVVLFAAGVACAKGEWLEAVPRRTVVGAVLVGALALPVLPAALLLAGAPDDFATGFSVAAVTYALWEPLVALGIIAGLVAWARGRGAAGDGFWSWAAANSYGAFVLHAPLLVASSRALEALGTPHALAFPVSVVATLAAAFGGAAALRRSAAVRRVL